MKSGEQLNKEEHSLKAVLTLNKSRGKANSDYFIKKIYKFFIIYIKFSHIFQFKVQTDNKGQQNWASSELH